MSIRFASVEFKNTNGIPVGLTVEAPIGTVVNQQTVPANTTVTINPAATDCPSVLLAVLEHDGVTYRQSYAMTKPKSGEGLPSYLEWAKVGYRVAEFWGAVQAREGAV